MSRYKHFPMLYPPRLEFVYLLGVCLFDFFYRWWCFQMKKLVSHRRVSVFRSRDHKMEAWVGMSASRLADSIRWHRALLSLLVHCGNFSTSLRLWSCDTFCFALLFALLSSLLGRWRSTRRWRYRFRVLSPGESIRGKLFVRVEASLPGGGDWISCLLLQTLLDSTVDSPLRTR